jgi:nitrite reductase/ring-hydroxylating ferredoxin subunit
MSYTEVASSEEVRENAAHTARIDGVRLLLTRVEGQVRAIENRCPHLNLSMARGKVDGKVITCPWHGSTFDVCTGENLDWITAVAGMKVPDWSKGLIAFGKKPAAVRTFPAREENGRVLVDVR